MAEALDGPVSMIFIQARASSCDPRPALAPLSADVPLSPLEDEVDTGAISGGGFAALMDV
ncbi:hypothetical protein WNY39_11820 [Sulfitobacter sp. AS59]